MTREIPQLSPLAQSIRIGSVYQHYKGAHYKVLAVAFHEETHEELVIYANDAGIVWARPVSLFLENVTVEGKLNPRFTLKEV